jgi:hypothetical protein
MPGQSRKSKPKTSRSSFDQQARTHRQQLIKNALEFKTELEQFEKTKDRTILIKALRDQFLITRYDSATLVEQNRLRALEVLIDRVPNMSDNMLMRTIETLSNVGEVDLNAITGAKNGPLISLHQNVGMLGQGGMLPGGSGKVSLDGNPVKKAGELLEALEHIANHFRSKTIEHKPADDDNA